MPAFADKVSFPTDTFPQSVAVGDLNGDGKPDLTTANLISITASVLLNTTAPGAAQFGTVTSSVDEGGGTSTVQITRAGGSEGTFSVNVAVLRRDRFSAQ